MTFRYTVAIYATDLQGLILYKHKSYINNVSKETNNDPNLRYIKMFNHFFEHGKMSGTYKAVFLRSLTDIGEYDNDTLVGKQWIDHQGDRIKLDLNFIAARLAKYYWDMEIAFKMRHTPKLMANSKDPEADLNIVKLIKKESEKFRDKPTKNMVRGSSLNVLKNNRDKTIGTENALEPQPPTLTYIASVKMQDFRLDVIKHAMAEVLDHLPHDMPDLYKRVTGEKYIILEPTIVGFMKSFSPVIKKALNYMLAVHLEKHNPGARHIAIKIDAEKEFDKRLKLSRELEIQIVRKNEDDDLTTSLTCPSDVKKEHDIKN